MVLKSQKRLKMPFLSFFESPVPQQSPISNKADTEVKQGRPATLLK